MARATLLSPKFRRALGDCRVSRPGNRWFVEGLLFVCSSSTPTPVQHLLLTSSVSVVAGFLVAGILASLVLVLWVIRWFLSFRAMRSSKFVLSPASDPHSQLVVGAQAPWNWDTYSSCPLASQSYGPQAGSFTCSDVMAWIQRNSGSMHVFSSAASCFELLSAYTASQSS